MDLQLFNFIPLLRCPVSRQTLEVMNTSELDKLNEAIANDGVFNYDGEKVLEPLKEALITKDHSYVYPVLEGFIPVLLMDRAICLAQHDITGQGDEEEKPRAVPREKFSLDKKSVQQFYDDFGWKKKGEGYNDTLTFEDRRPVAAQYWRRCHLRLNKYLPGGEYLLDIASGSIPNDEYLTYCQKYKLRICMDFSLLAMKEAAIRLKGKGIFIVADMTNIPLKENCIDGLISMHTVYHIPRKEQNLAIEETQRVLRKNGQAVIVYSWKNPALMKLSFRLWDPVIRTYKALKKQNRKKAAFNSAQRHPDLFVQQQNYDWYANEISDKFDVHLKVYSAISRSFSNTFIRKKAFGQQISSFIFWLEDTFPSLMGRWGQYPVFLLKKKEKTVPERKIIPAKDNYTHPKRDNRPAMVRQKKTGRHSADKTFP